MNRTDAPAKQPKPFGINGQREPLLPTTPSGDNTASYEQGFPPITMILKSAGGLPPKGQDMNQILYELSDIGRWASTGAVNTFDSAFASAIGGYPKGSMLVSDDLTKFYISINDENTNNPNEMATGWQDLPTFLGLTNVLHKGDGRLLAGTYVSDAEDAKSIGARAATGCQFMRAYKAPDAPDQVNYWQIITMTDVVSSTSKVVVLAITSSTNAFSVGYGTGAGITTWRSIPALEGASFLGDISAPNINAEYQVKVGDAIFRSDGDVYGSAWGSYGLLSGYLTGTFPKRTEVDEWLSQKPNRRFITQVGLYESDKTKPFMLHDDGTGVFLATKDMLPTASLGMTGWHKDNSTGLITQWGEITTSQAAFRVNFPLAFPNNCFGVTVSDRNSFSSVGTSNRTTTGFDLNSSFNGTTNSFYIAKGV